MKHEAEYLKDGCIIRQSQEAWKQKQEATDEARSPRAGENDNAASGSGGDAVRRSGSFFIPIASCLQGTILAPTQARLPTTGSVAHGY
jgi:hypothetical protein